MMKYRQLLWLVLLPLALSLAGCATAPLLPGCIRLGPDGQFCPLPPAELPAGNATHIVSINRPGKRQVFIGRLRIDNQALRLAASSLFGAGLFTITYDGSTIRSKPAGLDLHSDLVVVMLEAAIADPAALRPRLHNLTIKVRPTADGEVRDLYTHGHHVAHIERSGASLSDANIAIHILPAKTTLVLRPMEQP